MSVGGGRTDYIQCECCVPHPSPIAINAVAINTAADGTYTANERVELRCVMGVRWLKLAAAWQPLKGGRRSPLWPVYGFFWASSMCLVRFRSESVYMVWLSVLFRICLLYFYLIGLCEGF